jgi:glutathione S-transferase
MDSPTVLAAAATGAAALAAAATTFACAGGGAQAPPLPKTSIKLYYWPATGLAEVIRLLLADSGIEWEDVNFERSQGVYSSPTSLGEIAGSAAYAEYCAACRAPEKGGNATTNIPMLEVDGKFYTQSSAVYNLVARRVGLYPAGVEEAFVVDNVLAHVADAKGLTYGAMMGSLSEDKLRGTELPKHVGNLERLLGDKAYFAGAFSLADVSVFDCLYNFFEPQTGAVLGATSNYPRLTALCLRVKARPGIAAYLGSAQCARIDRMVALDDCKPLNRPEPAESAGMYAKALAAAAAAPPDESLLGLTDATPAPVCVAVPAVPAPQYARPEAWEKPLRLTYFAIQGLGEVPRLMLAEAGAAYESVAVYGGEQGTELAWRTASPNGLLPTASGLGIAHTAPICQSGAIIRFLAKQYGFLGSSEAMADVLYETAKDLGEHSAAVTGYAGGARVSDPNEEDGAAKGPWALILRIETMLEAAPDPVDADAALSFGQMQLFHLVTTLDATKAGCVGAVSEKLEAFRATVAARGRIAAYLAGKLRYPLTKGELGLGDGDYAYNSGAIARKDLV